MELIAIGTVESPLHEFASAPKQGREGAPDAWLVFEARIADGLDGIEAGDDILVLTWLDRAARDVLRVHPRDNPANPELHRVQVVSIEGRRFRVRNLEALNGTPIIDVKPALRDLDGPEP